MSFIKQLTSIVSVLETYRGRDRLIRLVSYFAMLMGGDGKTSAQVKWKIISAEMSACRVILRLFDDLPMLMFNFSTKFGFKEKGILRWLELTEGISNQAFYFTEHVAWLRQKKILQGRPVPYLFLVLVLSVVVLLTSIIKSLIRTHLLRIHAQRLHKQRELDKDGSGYTSTQNAEITENLKKLTAEQKDQFLLLIQYFADLTNVVSWLPPGVLWAQKLSPAANGILGIIASLIMLYRNWPSGSQ